MGPSRNSKPHALRENESGTLIQVLSLFIVTWTNPGRSRLVPLMRYEFRDAPKMHATIISCRIPPCSDILLLRSVGRTIPSIPNGENPISTRRKSCRDTPPSSGQPDRSRPKVRAGRGYGRRFACPMPDPLRQGGCVKGTDDRRISRRGDEIASGPESAFRLKPLHCATARGRLIIRKPAALRDEAISSQCARLRNREPDRTRASCAPASRQRAQRKIRIAATTRYSAREVVPSPRRPIRASLFRRAAVLPLRVADRSGHADSSRDQ